MLHYLLYSIVLIHDIPVLCFLKLREVLHPSPPNLTKSPLYEHTQDGSQIPSTKTSMRTSKIHIQMNFVLTPICLSLILNHK